MRLTPKERDAERQRGIEDVRATLDLLRERSAQAHAAKIVALKEEVARAVRAAVDMHDGALPADPKLGVASLSIIGRIVDADKALREAEGEKPI